MEKPRVIQPGAPPATERQEPAAPPRPSDRKGRWRVRLAAGVAACCWAYLAFVLGLWLLLWLAADRWWPMTFVLYGPRWVWALPVAFLAPWAAWLRRKMLGLLLVTGLLVLGPVMGFCVPWRAMLPERAGGLRVRVLSCNVEGNCLNTAEFSKLIALTWPDVVALQEWSPEHGATLFRKEDWHVHVHGDLCLASRFPILNAENLDARLLDQSGFAARYELQTPHGPLHFFNFHLATPRYGLEDFLDDPTDAEPMRANITLRRQNSETARRWVGEVEGPFLVAGDFNLPADSAIYRQYWGPLTDAFSSAGLGLGHTKFTSYWGIRIDHVLAGPGWRCRRCWVGPDVESDHRPVIADLVGAE